jgi:lipoprotein-releasing system ATP-binding protein
MTILTAVGISKRYESTAGGISVLKDLNFELSAGERVAIVGASGAGKSTLLNVLGGLDRATSGQVLLGDRDLTNLDEGALCEWRNQNLGFVFQFHHLMPEFSALEAVAMPAEIAGKTRQEAMALAEELLGRLGLSERLHHRPNRLSGGEKQRVAIGRALINRPLCLLMDEPTGNLDPLTAESVMALMRDVVFEATSFVIVTHDPAIAASTDKQYELANGQLIERT